MLWYELHWRYWSISLWHDVKRARQAIECHSEIDQ